MWLNSRRAADVMCGGWSGMRGKKKKKNHKDCGISQSVILILSMDLTRIYVGLLVRFLAD